MSIATATSMAIATAAASTAVPVLPSSAAPKRAGLRIVVDLAGSDHAVLVSVASARLAVVLVSGVGGRSLEVDGHGLAGLAAGDGERVFRAFGHAVQRDRSGLCGLDAHAGERSGGIGRGHGLAVLVLQLVAEHSVAVEASRPR